MSWSPSSDIWPQQAGWECLQTPGAMLKRAGAMLGAGRHAWCDHKPEVTLSQSPPS